MNDIEINPRFVPWGWVRHSRENVSGFSVGSSFWADSTISCIFTSLNALWMLGILILNDSEYHRVSPTSNTNILHSPLLRVLRRGWLFWIIWFQRWFWLASNYPEFNTFNTLKPIASMYPDFEIDESLRPSWHPNLFQMY